MTTDWDDYRFFLAVAQAGSLSAAARRLRVSQPTVGRRLADLERRLGARLVARGGDGYALTDAGARIRGLVERMDQEAASIERRVGGEDSRPEGRVILATTEGLAAGWLAPRLGRFRRRFPGIDLGLLVGIRTVDLLRREADIALRMGNPGCDELIGQRAGRIVCGLFAAAGYLAARGEPRRLEDLHRHAIIESTSEIADLRQAARLRELAHGAEVALSCNNVVAQIAAAEAGLGLLALPCYLARRATGLRQVLAEAFTVEIELWLLTHRDLQRTARVRAMLDFLAEEIRADRDLDGVLPAPPPTPRGVLSSPSSPGQAALGG